MRRLSALVGGIAILAVPMAARADDDAAGAAIVVIATPLAKDPDAAGESASDLEASRAVSIAEQLVRRTPGVTVADMQGNPLQADISFRGFTASPLLGTPQGLAVYLDGVRFNQPFGEVVSWDLIPTEAIATVTIASGAAPQFGRNALGGAVVLRTKDGRSDPGARLSVSGGSSGRAQATIEAGGTAGSAIDWFVAADRLREQGWRAFSPSRATRLFGKAGWSGADSHLSLSALYGRTELNGNGLQEMRLLAADRSSVYTAPDTTRNRAVLVALNGDHRLSGSTTLRANAFWRRLRTATENGDVNEGSLGQNPYQPNAAERSALGLAGYAGFPLAGESQANTPFPKWRCIANVLLNDEPNEKCNALLNRSHTDQSEWGGGIEAMVASPIGGHDNVVTLGLGYVRSLAHFTQSTQFGYLLPDHRIQPVDGPGAFADGTQSSENAFDARVDLRATTSSFGVYAADSLAITPALRLDLAGRYDRTSVRNRDAITPGGGMGSLDSAPAYSRFNPAATLRWQPRQGLALTASWSQASRAPSAIELGCSDPASPCRLPNALAGDPPLRQVIAHSTELRAEFTGSHWSASAELFRTDSSDDILFVANDTSGFGYFRNFGRTRRQGLALEGRATLGKVTLQASYTMLDATYRSPELVGGRGNSSSDAPAPGFEGAIAIEPGDRIPPLPRHTLKLAVNWAPASWLSLDLDMTATSGVYARGNENNRHAPDGRYFLGEGRTAGYALVNAGIELRPRSSLTVFATVRNLFAATYASAAQLGVTAFDAQGRFVARPFSTPVIGGERPLLGSTFFAPGAPRSIVIGVRAKF